MSKKPIIGITTATATNERRNIPFGRFILNSDYVERVSEAGGVPILIPPGTDVQAVAELLDGLLIPGGDDLDPSLWGDDIHPEAQLESPARTQTEMSLLKAVAPEMPIFGICYGCQLLNVVYGGTLEQHLPDLLGHDGHRGDPMQDYQVVEGTKLHQILGSPTASGRTWHHQAVKAVAPGLRVSAKHEDGTIEGLEDPSDRWVIGVQWHPERSESETTPALFRAFLRAAKDYQESKTSCGTW